MGGIGPYFRRLGAVRAFFCLVMALACTTAVYAGAAKTVTDQLGRVVRIPETPARVALVNVHLEEVAAALGVWDQVVSLPRSSLDNRLIRALNLPSRLTTSFSDTGHLNLETLIKARPDVVVTWAGNRQLISRLEQLGLPVVAVHPRDFQGMVSMIRLLGEVLGKSERARVLVKGLEELAGVLRVKTEGLVKKRVMWLGGTPTMVYGTKWIFHDLIEMAGARDVCRDLYFKSWVTELSVEQVVKLDPQVVVIGGWAPYSPRDLLEDPRWAPVSAVAGRRVFKTPSRRANFSPYAALMAVMTAHWCHPRTLDPQQTGELLDWYHRKYYRIGFRKVHPQFARRLLN